MRPEAIVPPGYGWVGNASDLDRCFGALASLPARYEDKQLSWLEFHTIQPRAFVGSWSVLLPTTRAPEIPSAVVLFEGAVAPWTTYVVSEDNAI